MNQNDRPAERVERRVSRLPRELLLEPADNSRLANLCGPFDENLRLIERTLGVEIRNRGGRFLIFGAAAERTERLLRGLYRTAEQQMIDSEELQLALAAHPAGAEPASTDSAQVHTRQLQVVARGEHQQQYLHSLRTRDITFGIGPAGTGKTYLAVAVAVEALESERVRRLVLVRPAVEAGERLGFLPGDMAQKVDPYLRPIYDALYDMLGFNRVSKLIERGIIEVAPLAFMRGRTLNEAFVLLDEAQNTTVEQMKMVLTRLGYGSRLVITGDTTQIDLPREKTSGLGHVIEVLRGVEGIGFITFSAQDVVRHPMVQRIIEAYEASDSGA